MTQEEKSLLETAIYDLLTGNFLLGRPRTDDQKNMLKEFCYAVNLAEKEKELTPRQIELLKTASEEFYGGVEDMCEQLNINKILISLLNK